MKRTLKKASATIIAVVSATAMMASMTPAYASEIPTSGTFNEIFSWEVSGDTLTFKVDESYTDFEYVALSTGGSSQNTEDRPWIEYLPQIKHIVLDERIGELKSNIWGDFSEACENGSASFETVTAGEAFESCWCFGDAVIIAPKYSYTDYSAFMEGVTFRANGVAENPYLIVKDEAGSYEYIDDSSLMKITGEIQIGSTMRDFCGRSKYLLITEECTNSVTLNMSRINSYALRVPSVGRVPITLCYPSFGAENMEYLRAHDYPYVCLGEENSTLKGDANLDGSIDIGDAAAVLEYYSKKSAGLDVSFNDNEEINKFAYFLADTDTESTTGDNSEDAKIDTSDAQNILAYYAQSSAGLSPEWDTIVNGN